MLQHGVEHFPRVALFWRLYAEHERATRGPEVAWKLLSENEEKALCWCRCDADLWRVAAECCRDAHPREERASESTELVGRTFERAVAAAGAAPEATALWRAYRDWAANSAPVAQRAQAKASLLRRASPYRVTVMTSSGARSRRRRAKAATRRIGSARERWIRWRRLLGETVPRGRRSGAQRDTPRPMMI